jgi:hypothetical protein
MKERKNTSCFGVPVLVVKNCVAGVMRSLIVSYLAIGAKVSR